MRDLGRGFDNEHPLASLPRAWWFPPIPGYRPDVRATYARYDLDDQPPIAALDDQLSWLEADAEKTRWSIEHGEGDQQVSALTVRGLQAVADGLPCPHHCSCLHVAAICSAGSAAACYLDLADFAAPVAASDGYLIHLLSDQQWCRHWLLYLDTGSHATVITTTEPIGYNLPDDWPPPPPIVPTDGTVDLEVCADSFTEFLHRFWIENEIHFAVREGRALTRPAASYAAQLTPWASSPETANLRTRTRDQLGAATEPARITTVASAMTVSSQRETFSPAVRRLAACSLEPAPVADDGRWETRCVSKADYLGQAVVRVAVLPARAAYLIRAASESGLRRAVQEACSRWGGMTEPIVPVKPDGEVDVWWQQVVTVARADLAVNVDVPDHDAAVAAQALGLELVTLGQISTGGVHPAFTGPAELPDRNGYVMGGENGPLWGAVAAGDLTAEHLADLSTDVLWVERAADDQLVRAQLAGRTLIERTVTQFREHWAHGGAGASPAIIWVTEPGSFDDCLYYWNLRALRPLRFQTVPMLLLPADQVQHWLGFPGQLAHVLARPDEFAPDVFLRSLSVGEAGLHETAAQLGLQQGTDDIRSGHRWPAAPRQAPFTYLNGIEVRRWFVFERAYGEVAEVDVHLFRDRTTVRFASPVSFSGGGQALVRLSGAPFDGLPRRPAVATRILAGSAWNRDALQISTRAQNDYLVELHIPDLPEAANTLLGEITARHELSDKGKLGMAWMDGTDISPLREPGVFAAIRDLTTPRSKELLRELLKLRAGGAVDDELAELAARWGGRRERRYRSAEGLEHVPTTDAPRVLEQLCGLGWAERGLGITCDTCGRPSFVAFPHATGRAACPGCASPARYDTGSALTVYYRLNSYLDQLSDQGVLPHLLAIAALECQGTRAYFLPGTNVWFADSDKDTAEADIFGIRDGQILAGEVKTSAAEFTADQIKRDADLSKRLGADVHVLAATDDIPEGIAEIAKAQCDARGLGVIVLQREDLLPEASG